MKTAFVILLCAMLTASFIWGCSMYSRAEGLEGSLMSAQRQYEVLQILYTQARQEADELAAARDREAAARLDTARPSATAAPAEGLSAVLRLLTGPESSPSPSPLPSPTPEIIELAPLFPLPESSPAPSPAPTAAPITDDAQG